MLGLSFLFPGGCGGGEGGEQGQQGKTTTAAPPAGPTSPQPAERSLSIEVRNGAVVGGRVRFEARTREQLRIVVRSDVADEVHLHGYDLRAQVTPAGQAIIEVRTDIPGVFEMELEKHKLRLGELVVKG